MKNSTMKRLLAGALSAAMIFTSMPANFLAEEVNQAAEEAVIAAEEGAAEEAAAGETGAELADALYDEGIQMPDSSPETGEDAGLIADADPAEFSEALTESDEEIVDSLDEFEEIEEFIVDEEMVLEEEVLFDEEYAEPETDSFEDEWIDESAIALEEDPEISEGEVLLTTDKTHLDTGETFEFSIQAPGAEWIELFFNYDGDGDWWNWHDRWDGESCSDNRSYGHSGTYKLVARAHYSDEDDDCMDSDPVTMTVQASTGEQIAISRPEDLPVSLMEGGGLSFTVVKPANAEGYRIDVWYDHEDENDQSDTSLFHWDSNDENTVPQSKAVEIGSDDLSRVERNQVKVSVEAWAFGYDDAREEWRLPIVPPAATEKVSLWISKASALVNEDIHITVSPVSDTDTIRAIRFWDDGGFWEWGREMRPDDGRDQFRFDEAGNFSVEHSWGDPGLKTVFAEVTFDDWNDETEEEDGGRTWYTTDIGTVSVSKNGDIGNFTFSLDKATVTRGDFVTVVYSGAENADHYWCDIEYLDEEKNEWEWWDHDLDVNPAPSAPVISAVMGTADMEPGKYRFHGQACGFGYQGREADTEPIELTVNDAGISEGEVLLTTDKTDLKTGEEFVFSIQAPGAQGIELFFDYEGEGDWWNWRNGWGGESRSESHSYGHSGTYQLVARAHYSDEDDDYTDSEAVVMNVNAPFGQIAISRPDNLPFSLTEGDDLLFTVVKPDNAEGYRIDVWYDHEDENDQSDTSLFHWDSNEEGSVPESRTVQITSDELSRVERNQVKVCVEGWAAGYDDAREEWVLPLLGQAATDKVNIILSRSEALVNEDIHITVSPVSDADTIRAIRFWDDGGFWEWGREMRPDDEQDRDRFDDNGNFSVETSWDRAGDKTVYAQVTFEDFGDDNEDENGNDRRTWYTSEIKTVKVSRQGFVGPFEFRLDQTTVARGGFLTVTYTEAENADHYWIDIEQWDADREEWNWFDNAAHADEAGPMTFGTADLEPGSYRIYGQANAIGYERSEANGGAPIGLTVTEAEIPEGKILFDVDKQTLETQEPYKLTAYAPGARWIEVFYDVDNGYEWSNWWGGESFTDRSSYGHSGNYRLMARAHYFEVDEDGWPLYPDEHGNPEDETTVDSDPVTVTVTAPMGPVPSISLPDSLPGFLTPGDDLSFTVERPEGAEHFEAEVWYDRDDEGVTLFRQDKNPGEGDTINVTVTSQQLSQLKNGQIVKVRVYASAPGWDDTDDYREIPYLEADDEAVSIEVSAEEVTVGEAVHITVSPVDGNRTIKALRFWDDGGFWEWGNEIRPDDGDHRDWFDDEGNFSVEHSWDRAGDKIIYAQVTFDDFEDGNEDENGNDRRTWYTSEAKTVKVTKQGDVGDFTFSLDQDTVSRGKFVKVTYTEAAHADHYWVDIEALHEPDAEDHNRYWYWYDHGAHADRAGETALGTATLEPGTYRLYASASGYGYERKDANNGQPIGLTVTEAQVPEEGILLTVDKKELITQQDFSVSAHAPDAKWIELYFDYENNPRNHAWRGGDSITEQRGYSAEGNYRIVAIAHYFETDEHGNPLHPDENGNPSDDTTKQAEETITVTAPNGDLIIDISEEAFLDSLTWNNGLCYTAVLPENAVYLETGAWYDGDDDILFQENNEETGDSQINVCIPEDQLKTDGDEPLGIWIYASAPGFNDVLAEFEVPTAKIKNLIDQVAVDAAREAVNSLPKPAKESDAARIAEVKEIVNGLSDSQKALLDEGEFDEMLGKIAAAENEVKAAKEAREKAAADQAAANSVIAKINALPAKPGVADEAAVNAARAAYNALSADQKKLVNAATLSKLTGAESSVASAKAAAKAAADAAAAKAAAEAAAAKAAAEAAAAKAAAAAQFSLNVGNGTSVPLQVKKSSKNIMVETIADGDSLATATSANTKVVTAKVSGSRVVIKAGKKPGKAAVTVTSAMGGTVTFTVKVQKGKVTTKGVKVPQAKITMKKGEKLDLKARLNPITSPDKMKFSTASKKIAAVSGKGIVTAKGAGKVKITIKAGSKKKVVTVTVTN